MIRSPASSSYAFIPHRLARTAPRQSLALAIWSGWRYLSCCLCDLRKPPPTLARRGFFVLAAEAAIPSRDGIADWRLDRSSANRRGAPSCGLTKACHELGGRRRDKPFSADFGAVDPLCRDQLIGVGWRQISVGAPVFY